MSNDEVSLGWHYQATRTTYKAEDYEETVYELVEAYPTKEAGDGGSWTDGAVNVQGDTKEGLVKWLRKAADDVERYDAIDNGVKEWSDKQSGFQAACDLSKPLEGE